MKEGEEQVDRHDIGAGAEGLGGTRRGHEDLGQGKAEDSCRSLEAACLG